MKSALYSKTISMILIFSPDYFPGERYVTTGIQTGVFLNVFDLRCFKELFSRFEIEKWVHDLGQINK